MTGETGGRNDRSTRLRSPQRPVALHPARAIQSSHRSGVPVRGRGRTECRGDARLRGVHGTSLPARPKHVCVCSRSPVLDAAGHAVGAESTGRVPGVFGLAGSPRPTGRRGTRTAAGPPRGSGRAAPRARSWFPVSPVSPPGGGTTVIPEPARRSHSSAADAAIERHGQQAVGVHQHDELGRLGVRVRPRPTGPSGSGRRSAARRIHRRRLRGRWSSAGSMLSWQLPNRSTHQTSPTIVPSSSFGSDTSPGTIPIGSISSPSAPSGTPDAR